MFAVIDCGTTNTTIFILSDDSELIAQGTKKIGVRDTSITGSRQALKNGVEQLYFMILKEHGIDNTKIKFAIASGMITSEIGLIEIPHLVAPCGLKELSDHIEVVKDPKVLDIGVPIYFIRGVRNNYGEDATAHKIRQVDFMRGEEVQCMGILEELKPQLPVNIVVLSSHTKLIHMDKEGKIRSCLTTMSGQIFEALKTATNVGKSIVDCQGGEEAGGYSFEEIVAIAKDCAENAGFIRTMLMPRFMQVLLKTNSEERTLFVDAAIAVDDMKAFMDFNNQGYKTSKYILFGHRLRCKLYTYLIKQYLGSDVEVESIYDEQAIADMTIKGVIITAKNILKHYKPEKGRN
ncbi:MAG TPA: hypothetical protein GXZ27_04495 [Thermoanaerobacterales bacterium]|jgi:2-dehydro-3-deoxygalactonokinase|nr:hypothetical protein [Thermoanaerobacterales bacterium]